VLTTPIIPCYTTVQLLRQQQQIAHCLYAVSRFPTQEDVQKQKDTSQNVGPLNLCGPVQLSSLNSESGPGQQGRIQLSGGPVPNVNGAPVLPSYSFTIGYMKSGPLPHYFECGKCTYNIFSKLIHSIT